MQRRQATLQVDYDASNDLGSVTPFAPDIPDIPDTHTDLTNWSKTGWSPCTVVAVRDSEEIRQAIAVARAKGLPVIARGGGQSYTDAALNTNGIVIDMAPMRRILAWDPTCGVMRVESGVTLRDMTQLAWQDGWWPAVSPSTPDATVGGCVAMNVTGKNAWKCGSFGEHLLALDVLLADGQARTLLPDRDARLFHAFIGGAGLLGVITAMTVQLQRIPSGNVTIHSRSAASFAEVFAIFDQEQQRSDFIEAWLDGFATGPQLGRGCVTCASFGSDADQRHSRYPTPSVALNRLETSAVRLAARLCRVDLLGGVRLANSALYWGARWFGGRLRRRNLIPYTYYSPAAFAGYHALLPEGFESFQAFVPRQQAAVVFAEALRSSQAEGCTPIWCIVKQHRPDPFLLSYQVDGFSLELYYPRLRQTSGTLERLLRRLIALVLAAGGRFYLAKDHFLTHAQYRQSIGDATVDAFLQLKRHYDPETLFQSDLFRRVFQPPLEAIPAHG